MKLDDLEILTVEKVVLMLESPERSQLRWKVARDSCGSNSRRTTPKKPFPPSAKQTWQLSIADTRGLARITRTTRTFTYAYSRDAAAWEPSGAVPRGGPGPGGPRGPARRARAVDPGGRGRLPRVRGCVAPGLVLAGGEVVGGGASSVCRGWRVPDVAPPRRGGP